MFLAAALAQPIFCNRLLYVIQGRLAALAAGAGCGRPQAAVLAGPLGRPGTTSEVRHALFRGRGRLALKLVVPLRVVVKPPRHLSMLQVVAFVLRQPTRPLCQLK